MSPTNSLPDAGKAGSRRTLPTADQSPSPWLAIAIGFMTCPKKGKLRFATKKPKTAAHFVSCQSPQSHFPAFTSRGGSDSSYELTLLERTLISEPRSLLPTSGLTTTSASRAAARKIEPP